MKRMTLTLTKELEAAVDAFQRDQAVPATLTAIAQTALTEYLAERGYLAPLRPLRITPAAQGSGDPRGSMDHDRLLADAVARE